MANKAEAPAACPCGGADYARCCQPYHQGAAAEDAAALMRSRYSAYVLKRADYLLATWHPRTRPETLGLGEDDTRWIGLTVKRHDSPEPDHAVVEFVARYKVGGKAFRLHETSRFVREHGRWFYVDGDLHA